MQLYSWDRIEKEEMNPSFSRQVIHGGRMTVARVYLKAGSSVPEHSHHNEQICVVESGRLKFILDGKDVIVTAGEVLQIPPDLPHKVDALEDSVAFDLFAPIREDWIRGDDSYLRK